MNTIFKYNANAKYSVKDLRGGHGSNNFLLLDVFLNEKGPSVKGPSVMTMGLMRMKHECLGIGFINRIMAFLVMK